MVFHPVCWIPGEGRFILTETVSAAAHACLHTPLMEEFWHNFTFQSSSLRLSLCDEYLFSIGSAEKLPLDGNAYSIHITQTGVCVHAEDGQSLIWGVMTLLDRILTTDCGDATGTAIACGKIWDRPCLGTRMVHFCVFPETELWELRRFVRFCGALKYTHIVLEFWGTLRYDCMRELAWQSAFTKEEISPVMEEARALGLEVIPMFNHWGHASGSRVMHGKHVVLDQNPKLQSYFSEDGWRWDFRRDKVKALLRRIREELIALCGEGEYFHIGCDEAYNFDFSEEHTVALCDFINEISEELQAMNRRVIIWGDMLLYRHPHYNPNNYYTCNAPSPALEQRMLNGLSRNVLIADWQYHAKQAPVETADVFRTAGFDCLLCPWDAGEKNLRAVLDTAKEKGLAGVMHTTWHTLSSGMPYVLLAAVGSFDLVCPLNLIGASTYTAALWRKVMPISGDYAKAGWSRAQISYRW